MSKKNLTYIDFHTHRLAKEPGVEGIFNQIIGKESKGGFLHSAGIHPWYVTEDNLQLLKLLLTDHISQHDALAIGECGLDKICPTPMEVQKEAFLFQIDLAKQIRKPLIIHCVRAYQEVMHLLESQENQVPVVFHGFNKHRQLAHDLLNAGYYLSFGKSLFQERIQQVLASCPIDKIFLETDGESFSVKELYHISAETLGIPVETLQRQIIQNYHAIIT